MTEEYEIIRRGLSTAEAGMEISLNVLREMNTIFPNRELSLQSRGWKRPSCGCMRAISPCR